MTERFLTDGLFGRLRADSGQDWHAYVGHAFVAGLGDGTLPQAAFQSYLVQDYLYLLQYARAYALAIYKSPSLLDMRQSARIVSGLLETELSLHVGFCADWGLSEADLLAAPESLELLAYSRYLLDRGMAGDILDLLVVLSACVVGYAEIGLRLLHDPATRLDGNPYRRWIETYSGAPYLAIAAEAANGLERIAATHGAEARYPMLLDGFRTAVRLEAAFWTAGGVVL